MFGSPLWAPRPLRELVRLRQSLKTAIIQWRNHAKAGE
jgi:hypothetical protein